MGSDQQASQLEVKDNQITHTQHTDETARKEAKDESNASLEVGGTDGTDKKDAITNQMNKSNEEIGKEDTKPIDNSADTQSTDSQPKVKTWGKSGSKKTDATDVAEPEATPVKLKKAAPKQKPA